MVPALALTAPALTALFVVTGGWALVRLAQVATRRGPDADVVAELVHLVMSAAMIAMTWGVVTGPSGPGGVATLVVFGLVMAWASVRLVRGTARHRPAATGHHLLMAVAMIWMVAAMPRIMGITVTGLTGDRTTPSPGAHDVDAMSGMPGMAGTPAVLPAGDTGPSAWVTALTGTLLLMLVAAAVLWVLRLVRTSSGPAPGEPAGGQGGGVAVLTPVAAPARVASTGIARLDAGCHALMSLGMAGMIAAML